MTSPGTGNERPRQVVVVGPDGQPVGALAMPLVGEDDGPDDAMNVSEMVEQPAKVMRIGTMIKQLLEEVRAAPLDDASRQRLRDIHASYFARFTISSAPGRSPDTSPTLACLYSE